MKNILILLFLVAGLPVFGQDKTISKQMPEGATYYTFPFATADTLTENQDTIDLIVKYQTNEWIKKLTVKTRFDIRVGADTTVSTSVFGKEFYDDGTYVQIIAASTSSAVTANNTIQILSSDYTETVAAAQDLISQAVIATPDTVTVAARTVTPLDKSYRFFRIRYIYHGPDLVGTGIKLDDFEIKAYTD